MNDTECPHCGAVWAIGFTPVSGALSNVMFYRGNCICGHHLKDLDALGHAAASLFRLIKPSRAAALDEV